MTDYEAYTNYLALKLHFAGNYDFFKYNGKVSASFNSFKKRKDKYQFLKLSKKLSDEQIIDYYVANLIRDKHWIGEFNQKNWLDHKRIHQSLEYHFENDIEKLLTSAENFDIIFNSVNGNHPKLIKAYLGKKISLETMVILNKLLDYIKSFDNEIVENYIWPVVGQRIIKYTPFVNVNKRIFRSITVKKIQEIYND